MNVKFTKWGKYKFQKLWQNFAINQNGANGEIFVLRGKLRCIPVLVMGKFMGKICGENLWGKFAEKIYGENLRGKFAGKICGENL